MNLKFKLLRDIICGHYHYHYHSDSDCLVNCMEIVQRGGKREGKLDSMENNTNENRIERSECCVSKVNKTKKKKCHKKRTNPIEADFRALGKGATGWGRDCGGGGGGERVGSVGGRAVCQSADSLMETGQSNYDALQATHSKSICILRCKSICILRCNCSCICICACVCAASSLQLQKEKS